MIKTSVFQRAGVEVDAELPAYAWPGGYQILYYTAAGDPFCPDCVNGQNGSDVRVQDDPQWNIDFLDIFYEGPPEYCSHCNAEVESAYGDPDADTTDGETEDRS